MVRSRPGTRLASVAIALVALVAAGCGSTVPSPSPSVATIPSPTPIATAPPPATASPTPPISPGLAKNGRTPADLVIASSYSTDITFGIYVAAFRATGIDPLALRDKPIEITEAHGPVQKVE